MKKLIALGAVGGLALALLLPMSASATTEGEYVTAVWSADGTNQWPSEGQTLVASQAQNDKILDTDYIEAEAAKLGCGYTIQGDLYLNDETTNALLEGGKLYGPSNPKESWPDGKYRGEYSTVFYTGDCPTPVTATFTPADAKCVDNKAVGNSATVVMDAGVTGTYTFNGGAPESITQTSYENIAPGTYVVTFTAPEGSALVGDATLSHTFPVVPTDCAPPVEEPGLLPASATAEVTGFTCIDGEYTGNSIQYSAEHATLSVTKNGEPFDGALTDLGAGEFVLTFTADEGYEITGQKVFEFTLVVPTEGCVDVCDLEESSCGVDPCDPTTEDGECVVVTPPVETPPSLVTTGVDAATGLWAAIGALVLGGGLMVMRRRVFA